MLGQYVIQIFPFKFKGLCNIFGDRAVVRHVCCFKMGNGASHESTMTLLLVTARLSPKEASGIDFQIKEFSIFFENYASSDFFTKTLTFHFTINSTFTTKKLLEKNQKKETGRT